MYDDLHWLVIPQRVQYKLAVTVHRCLRHRALWYFADYCVRVYKVPGRQHMWSVRCHQLSVPRVRRSTFGIRAFSVARAQQPGIHCLIICAIQLLTPSNLGGSWRRICSPDIRNLSALELLRNRALQIGIFLLTYLLLDTQRDRSRDEMFKGGRKVPLHPMIPTPLVDRVITRTALYWNKQQRCWFLSHFTSLCV